MNDPCPQQPVWGWTLSTDLRRETSVPLTPKLPPTLVSGAGWDTHIWQFSQEVSRFWWRLSLHAYPLQYPALSTANRWAPHQPSLPSLGLQQHPQWGQGLLTLLLPLFLSLCFLIASTSLLFSHCFKSVRLWGIVFPAHCLTNATKCLKCLKLLCIKESMGLSEEGRIKSPYSEL